MSDSKIILKKDKTLFSEGDQPDYAYLIESGEIKVQAVQHNTNVVIGTLSAGELIGEMSVIDNKSRTASAVALSDCVLIKIDKNQLLERVQKSDPIVYSLLTSSLRRYRNSMASFTSDKDKVIFADTNLFEQVTIDKIKLEAELKRALLNNKIEVLYEPILDISIGKIIGYQAHVQWNHHKRGLISPAEFISLAEETSLIFEVGHYIIKAACKAVKRFMHTGVNPVPFISVNVSAEHIAQAGFVDLISKTIHTENLPEGCIHISMTEGLSLDTFLVKQTIDRCHSKQIKVALNEFGTGFSNLSVLKKLKFDRISINEIFTSDMLDNARSLVLIKAIIIMANTMETDILATGIHSEKMLAAITKFKCAYAQGSHIGKAQTLAELSDMYNQQVPTRKTLTMPVLTAEDMEKMSESDFS